MIFSNFEFSPMLMKLSLFNNYNYCQMRKSISRILVFTFAIFISGCAASYTPINPAFLHYNSHDTSNGIELSYKYDVLRERGNSKYAKKEDKKGVKLVAIKMTNTTDEVINVNEEVVFYADQNQIFPMEPMATKESLKQIVPGYLPYLLLTFTNLTIYTGSSATTYPTGLLLGPGITIGNMAVAGTANQNMLYELYEYNILNKVIASGETVYGIIGVRDIGFSPISAKVKKHN